MVRKYYMTVLKKKLKTKAAYIVTHTLMVRYLAYYAPEPVPRSIDVVCDLTPRDS